MRRIEYGDQEYLIRTRSGWRLKDAMAEQGVHVDCQCQSGVHQPCLVKYPKDTLFLLTGLTDLELQVLDEAKVKAGYRLACQALFK